MGELLLVGALIYWLATDTKTALWVIGGVIALIVIGVLVDSKNGSGKRPAMERPRYRIDHLHYITEDESECSICGARFGSKAASCPHCGVRFNGSKTDEEAWDEEFDEECDMDEEEGW